MAITAVELKHAYRLLNHGPVVLVSATHAGKQNIMAAAWNMPLDFDPAKIAVVIDKNTYTRGLIEGAGTFAINVPCIQQSEIVMQVGSSSGKEERFIETDKFAAYHLPTFPAASIEAPLLEGCVAWLECRLLQEVENQQKYDLFIGEVVAAYADTRVFSNGRWHFEGQDQLRTLHYIAGGAFFATGDSLSIPPATL
ncbi:flavin reductase family protein [Methylobacillus gramineus]|uniref:flavin reductase family protein n=1 Tax=Methylobacillus gramineus TaxID=755169 RepID=UPI001CFFFF86|nr:flavin reductase family protein [Methylobacillus gramineus]MCB5183593.1 flavin reductase family protein [Methylobacillus gramineus]